MKTRTPTRADLQRVNNSLRRTLKMAQEAHRDLEEARRNLADIKNRLNRLAAQPKPSRATVFPVGTQQVSSTAIQQAHDEIAAASQQTSSVAETIGRVLGLGAIFLGSLRANLKKDDGSNRIDRAR